LECRMSVGRAVACEDPEDEEDEEATATAPVRHQRRSGRSSLGHRAVDDVLRFGVGDRVRHRGYEVNKKTRARTEMWYEGRVIKVHPDGSHDVCFDDGDVRERIALSTLREASLAEAPAQKRARAR
jgi:hypothetical protein